MTRDIGLERRHGSGAIRPGPCAVSVVIPTLDGGARFHALLERLARQDLDGGFELVVIDSSSRDGTAEAARMAGARVERIPRSEFQHGRTRNRAIALTSGERIVLLTQDALPMDERFLSALTGALDDPRIDGAFARQFPRPGCHPILADRLERWSASREQARVSRLSEGDSAAARAAFDALSPLERYQACAFDNVASCIRRSTWAAIPLPERPFGEDVAWARAVLLSGGALTFTPTARVEHSHPFSIRREFHRIRADHRNLAELFDLRVVTSREQVLAGWRAQSRFYRELLGRRRRSLLGRIWGDAHASVYALAEALAKFTETGPL
jgi:glycosyltransferase involved in cell wall biosynthesis